MRTNETKRKSVHRAPAEAIERRPPMDWRELVGKIRFYEGYDLKELSPVRGSGESVGGEENG